MIEVNLNVPNTPEERQMNIAGNVRSGSGCEKLVPFMDYVEDVDEWVEDQKQSQVSWAPTALKDDGKTQLRFYAVGPTTYQINCPLCKHRADTERVILSGKLGQLSCVLSLFSCCFPIFGLSLVYLCLQDRWKSKRLFCNKCGGHLGFYFRPT